VPSFAAMTASGRVYYHGPLTTDAWVPSDWFCSGTHLAANSNPNGGWSIAGCRGPDGAAWFSPFPANEMFGQDRAGGNIVNGPGVAWTNNDTRFSVIYAQGTDGAVWAHAVDQPTSVWTSLGGQVRNGVEAAKIGP
jgi:hypothetical protein